MRKRFHLRTLLPKFLFSLSRSTSDIVFYKSMTVHKGLKRAPTAQSGHLQLAKKPNTYQWNICSKVIEQKRAECSRRGKKRCQSVPKRNLGCRITIEKDNSVLVSAYAPRITPEDRCASVSKALPIRQWSSWLNAQKLRMLQLRDPSRVMRTRRPLCDFLFRDNLESLATEVSKIEPFGQRSLLNAS